MKISIVMPSFNQARYVEAALQSVLAQDYKNFEILFIDGGSTDGTMQIVENYREHLAYCVSESDKGQSDALHKGFVRATGDVLTWLNTDDLLLPGVLRQVVEAFSEEPERSWLLGNVVWIDRDDRILKCWRGEAYTPGWSRLGLLTAGGPSSYFRAELYRRVGGVNLDLHYQMDTELWWRFAMTGTRFHRLQGYTWALRLHEEAKVSGAMFARTDNEKQRRVSQCKMAEASHIATLTAGYCCRLPPILARAVSVARRAISPAYIHGIIDNWRFRGSDINRITERHKKSKER